MAVKKFLAISGVVAILAISPCIALTGFLQSADLGYLDKPSAPMLLVNGEKDTQQPIADLYLMMKHGDPKDVWVNPAGGHMGRAPQWPQGKIVETVVMPWIERKLNEPVKK